MKPGKLIRKRGDQVMSATTDSLHGSDDRLHQRVAEAAYTLYEQRGRQDGHDLEDWLLAESMVKSQP